MTEFVIPTAKIVDYLLNPAHPKGGPKCRLFLRFGFRIETPLALVDALVRHAEDHRARSELDAGSVVTKRIVAGPLDAPNGTRPHAISVWHVLPEGRERLITAYIRET